MESLDELREYSERLDAEEDIMKLYEEKIRVMQDIEAAKERGDSDVE